MLFSFFESSSFIVSSLFFSFADFSLSYSTFFLFYENITNLPFFLEFLFSFSFCFRCFVNSDFMVWLMCYFCNETSHLWFVWDRPVVSRKQIKPLSIWQVEDKFQFIHHQILHYLSNTSIYKVKADSSAPSRRDKVNQDPK